MIEIPNTDHIYSNYRNTFEKIVKYWIPPYLTPSIIGRPTRFIASEKVGAKDRLGITNPGINPLKSEILNLNFDTFFYNFLFSESFPDFLSEFPNFSLTFPYLPDLADTLSI